MAHPDLTAVLDRCIAEVKAGRKTLAQCLAEHPHERAELEPLLRIATAIVPPDVAPDPARKARARYALVVALQRERRPWWTFGSGALPPLARRLSAQAAAALVAALLVASGAVAFASQEALPGEPLYGVKTALEHVQLATAQTPEAKAAVYLGIATKRLAELERAVERGDPWAAQASAEAHAQAVADAEAQLALAEHEDRPVDAVVVQLEANIQRQEEALRRAADHAPAPAQASIARAREHAARGLQRAKERAVQRRAGAPAAAPSDQPPGVEGSRGAEPPVGPIATLAASAGLTATVHAARSATPTARAAHDLQQDLQDLAAQVEALAADAHVRGESQRGLQAKLDALREALERGQPQVARQQLAALRQQLEALRHAGHIGDTHYAALVQGIDALAAALGESPVAPSGETRGHGRDGAGPGAAQGPEITSTPAARPTAPGGSHEGRARGRRSSQDTPAVPSGRPTAVGPDGAERGANAQRQPSDGEPGAAMRSRPARDADPRDHSNAAGRGGDHAPPAPAASDSGP